MQHVPALAEHVQQSVAAWPTRHLVLANARNLPVREDRLTAYLSRTAPGSLVRVDAVDVAPVVGAIGAARDLSSALAAEVGRANTVIARRTWSAHQEFVERPDAPERLAAARHDAYRSLQQHAAAALRNARTR